MIAVEHKDTMHTNHEASVRCLQSASYPHNLHFSRTAVKVLGEPSDGTYIHPGGDSLDCTLSGEPIESSKESPSHTVYQHGFGLWSAFYPNSNMHLRSVNAVESQAYPYSVDNHYHYSLLNMFPQNYQYDYRFQDFQYFVVIDFEATCDKEKNPHPQEIIEFPSVIVNSTTGQLEACFQTYVRPTCNHLLSDFCKDLTGIQQIQVDRGVTLSEALLRHDKWLEKKGIKNTNFAVVTWSSWDCRVMLESECRYKKIRKPPYFNRWINLKVPFREVFGGARCNLKDAVQMAGLAWQGRAHCGLDDAKNTARLLSFLMHKGFRFSITDSLMYQPNDEPLTWKLPPDHPSFPSYQPQKMIDVPSPVLQNQPYCFCGVRSSKGMFRKPGPKQGSLFFGCGNWTAARGACCQYFEWALS
ncbi:3'-5' exoribonuclease 1 [Capsicum galapagoense]